MLRFDNDRRDRATAEDASTWFRSDRRLQCTQGIVGEPHSICSALIIAGASAEFKAN
jgi:hypothetical protein